MSNLSKKMQERLEKWRKNALPNATANIVRGDYGDDINDYQRKEQAMWQREQQMYGNRRV